MQNLATVSLQVGILFALMAVGAICRWRRLTDESSIKGFVNLLILVVTPCLIVDVFQRPFERAMLGSFALAFLLAFLAHVAVILVARATANGDERTRPVLRVATVFSNAGFMGLPLEYAILGAEGVFYGIVYVVMFNVFMWSWGLHEMRGAAKDGPGLNWRTLRPMIVNPGTIGVGLGLPLFLFSVQLPAALREPVHLLAGLNTPLAMLVIGHYLAGADFRRVVKMPSAHLAAFIRLVAYPLAVVGVLWLFRAHLDRTMMLAVVIPAAAPVGAMVTMFAAQFGRDVDLSVGLVSGTTLLSIVTMPPIIAFAMQIL